MHVVIVQLMHSIIIIFLINRGMRWGRKCGSNWTCYYCLFEKKLVKRFVQCHLVAQSTPGWHPSDKYPVNTSHRSRFVQKCFARSIIW